MRKSYCIGLQIVQFRIIKVSRSFKVKKLDVCGRPLFGNLVTNILLNKCNAVAIKLNITQNPTPIVWNCCTNILHGLHLLQSCKQVRWISICISPAVVFWLKYELAFSFTIYWQLKLCKILLLKVCIKCHAYSNEIP